MESQHLDNRISSELDQLQERLSAEDFKTVEDFLEDLGENKSTRLNYLNVLDSFATATPSLAFKKVTEHDVRRWLGGLKRRKDGKPASQGTKNQYGVYFKRFMQYVYGMKKRHYPACVDWFAAKRIKSKLKKSDLLTPKELDDMVGVSRTQMERTFISGYFESKCRPKEYLGLNVGDVEITTYGVTLHVFSKTGGTRPIPLVKSAPEFLLWLRMHPFRDDRDAPLWIITRGGPKKKAISYARAKQLIKTRAREAGISKRVYQYLLRHTGLTDACTKVKEPVLRKLADWSPASRMPEVYEHLSGEDVEYAILKAEGIDLEKAGLEKPEYLAKEKGLTETVLRHQKIDRLTKEMETRLDEARTRADSVIDMLMGDDEFRRLFKKKMREYGVVLP